MNMEKKLSPEPKEEKKDTSAFKGRTHFPQGEHGRWLESPESWKATGLPKEKRKLVGELSRQEFGRFIQKGEPERALNNLKTGRLKPPAGLSKGEAIKSLEKYLRK